MSDQIIIQESKNQLLISEVNNELIVQEQSTGLIVEDQGIQGPAGQGVPMGGTTDQALTKNSNTDYDTEWTTIDKAFVGLGNVDNTSDLNKPISTATQTALNAKVDSSTNIFTASPLIGGGDLTASRTVGITQAGALTDGYLSSADWNAFNSKQPAGNYITDLTGDVIATGPGIATANLSNTGVSAGSYSNPTLDVDSKGRITSISSGVPGAVTSVSSSDGTLMISPTTGAVDAVRSAITGDVDIPAGSTTSTLTNTGVTPGYYQIAGTTVDSKGRVTAIQDNTIITIINAIIFG